jgi:hypothetical protein
MLGPLEVVELACMENITQGLNSDFDPIPLWVINPIKYEDFLRFCRILNLEITIHKFYN